MHENREISGASRSDSDRDRSAKAQSHNADAHVSEKSDCAVVPMNQPNNVSAGIKQRHSRRFCSWEAAPLAGTRYALYMSF